LAVHTLSLTRWAVVLIVILAAGVVIPYVLMNTGGGSSELKTITYTP
jgi:hypothetical protein